MSRRKPGRYNENLKALRRYCDKRGFDIQEFDQNIYQFRIAGDMAVIDIWPSRMKVHIIASAYPEKVNDYRTLSFELDERELDELLSGEGITG